MKYATMGIHNEVDKRRVLMWRRHLISATCVLAWAMSRRVTCVVCLSATTVVLAAPAVVVGSPQAPATAPAAPRDSPTTPVADESATPPPLTGPRVQQDTFTAADEAPGSRNVNVSFADNFIADRLPFDVPFNVTGNVDTVVRRLELSVYRVSSSVDLAALITYLQTTVDCVGQRPPGSRVSISAGTPGPAGRFSLFVNALDPQYYYALCFVGVTPIATADIDPNARRILASTLPRLVQDPDISLAFLRVIHGVLRDRIAELGAGRPVPASIPPDNLFAATTPDQRFAELARVLTESYGNMAIPLRDYNSSLSQLFMDVAVARKGPANASLTTEILTGLPPASRTLPTPESALAADAAFNFSLYSFADTLGLLEAAANAAPAGSPQATALNDIVATLNEVMDAARLYGIRYGQLHEAAETFLSYVALEAREVTVALGSSVLGADLARSAYVSLDAGVAYPWRLETMVFYAGANIYFRPINKAAPLRYKGTFLHRFALTVGVTTTVSDESRRAEDLRSTPNNDDTSNSLLLGGGFRVTPSLRVGAGALVFKESDPNPLIEQTSVTVTPYVSFTADVNVAEIFRSLF
jgi:hypothetical protein